MKRLFKGPILGLGILAFASCDPAGPTDPAVAVDLTATSPTAPGPRSTLGPQVTRASGEGPLVTSWQSVGPEALPPGHEGPLSGVVSDEHESGALGVPEYDTADDILWENRATGAHFLTYMSGSTMLDGASLPSTSTNWRIAGVGDLNNDGMPDLVWQDVVTGSRYVWFMDGTSFMGEASLATVATNWSIAAVADFNGDANPDLFWQDLVSGSRTIWFLDGTTTTGGTEPIQVSPDWSVAGAGDFNGDTKQDLVWEDLVTGSRFVWFMDGGVKTGEVGLSQVSPDWSIVGIGDFNDDDKPDLLWQNLTTGQVDVWYMNGTTVIDVTTLPTVSTTWSIAGVIDGDATFDLPPVQITTSALSSGQVGTPYNQSLTATGGDGSYTWSMDAGSLPSGLSLAASTGVISGTPTGAGTLNFAVRVVSGDGQTALKGLSLTIDPAPSQGDYVYPLVVGPTGRHLVDQTGEPFLLVGDAAWSLMAQLTTEDAEIYLANRQGLGFTAILTQLIEHAFATNAPADIYGVPPFTGQAFTTPNEAYFARVDQVIQSAEDKGILVLLSPAYLGWGCSSQGWCAEVQAATQADMFFWGQWVGNRYKDFDNIMWVIGGDMDPTPVLSKMQSMVDGILSADSRHPFTAHNVRTQMAITPWNGASWLNVNNIYPPKTGRDYVTALSAYAMTPTQPFFMIESWYDGEGASAQQLRYQVYGTVLSGSFGHIYGDCPMWHFNAPSAQSFCNDSSLTWQSQLNNQGAMNMKYARLLFESRNWQNMVPDASHQAITSGYGTSGQTDYVTAAYGSDGSSIIAYLPSSRTVTVDGSVLAGGAMVAWWYNPGTGVATSIGTYATATPRSFTPPGSGDWVLVIDDWDLGFGEPGVEGSTASGRPVCSGGVCTYR